MFGTQKSSHWMLLLYYLLVVNIGIALTHPAITADKSDALINDSDLMDDDRSFENALINYLFAKQFLNRQRRHQGDIQDLQRKRSYWKQCAFNAVSCFG